MPLVNSDCEFIRKFCLEDTFTSGDFYLKMTTSNRFAVIWQYSHIFCIDLETGQYICTLSLHVKAGRQIPVFPHPCEDIVYISIPGNIYAYRFPDETGRLSLIADNCGKLLAISPSGKYLYAEKNENGGGLIKINLQDKSRTVYEINAIEIACTINDDFIYVYTTNCHICLVNLATGMIIEETYSKCALGTMRSTLKGLVAAKKDGNAMLFKPSARHKVNAYAESHIVRRWNFSTHQYDIPSITCPGCGNRLTVTDIDEKKDKFMCPICKLGLYIH